MPSPLRLPRSLMSFPLALRCDEVENCSAWCSPLGRRVDEARFTSGSWRMR